MANARESDRGVTGPGAAAIPLVDLAAFEDGDAAQRRRMADDIDEICRSIGFLIVANHGVPRQTCDDAWAMARAFFDLPVERKLLAKSDLGGSPRGYFPVDEESLGRTRGSDAPPDRKESFSSGPLSPPAGHAATPEFDFFYGPNIWPVEPAGFGDAWIRYYRAMEELGSRLMRLLAAALGLDADYFAAFHGHHLGALRALNYPQGGRTAAQRAAAHSDYGTVTILQADPQVGGLEIQLPSGHWIAAPVVQNAFIVNLGDLMARWTNDRWISTLHRVVSPGEDAPRRQSIAYFMNPDYDAEIGTLPTCLDNDRKPAYAPVYAGEYLLRQFRAANR